jgi:hypothetical protein
MRAQVLPRQRTVPGQGGGDRFAYNRAVGGDGRRPRNPITAASARLSDHDHGKYAARSPPVAVINQSRIRAGRNRCGYPPARWTHNPLITMPPVEPNDIG